MNEKKRTVPEQIGAFATGLAKIVDEMDQTKAKALKRKTDQDVQKKEK